MMSNRSPPGSHVRNEAAIVAQGSVVVGVQLRWKYEKMARSVN